MPTGSIKPPLLFIPLLRQLRGWHRPAEAVLPQSGNHPFR